MMAAMRHDGGEPGDARIAALSDLLPALVMVNAVVPTLAEIQPILSSASTAGQGSWTEMSTNWSNDDVAGRIGELYAGLGHDLSFD
jgi:hypothetical protein